ncbi:MAG: hypothetical protein VXY99_01625 [Pseudomonadota bacterium]|nr:hypothetical protein [Pseudomonadota bacterium]
MLETVENKFADIDFTKYQYLHAGTTGAAETAGAGRGRIVPVKQMEAKLREQQQTISDLRAQVEALKQPATRKSARNKK